MNQKYRIVTLDNGREWITDGDDFGMYADALPELIHAARHAVRVLWNREDKTEEEFRDATLALSEGISHTEDKTDPEDEGYYGWPIPRRPVNQEPCSECHGTGGLDATDCGGEYIKCEPCHGTGVVNS